MRAKQLFCPSLLRSLLPLLLLLGNFFLFAVCIYFCVGNGPSLVAHIIMHH